MDSSGPARWVAHVDVDCFFAQAEVLRRPELAGRPVAVGGTGGRGVVATASYEARRWGVRSAMPVAVARRACPQLVVLPPDVAWYRELSWQLVAACAQESLRLARVGLDEVYLEVGAGDVEVAHRLREGVARRALLRASVGLAPGAVAAKLAGAAAKPDGELVVGPDELRYFLDRHAVSAVGGVGPVAHQALVRAGIETVGEAHAAGRARLESVLGAAGGAALWEAVDRGGSATVTPGGVARSLSGESTFDADVADAAGLADQLEVLAQRALARLVASGLGAASVTVRARSPRFVEVSRTRRLGLPGLHREAVRVAVRSLAGELLEACGGAVRSAGVSLGGLSESVQPELWEDTGELLGTVPGPLSGVRHEVFGTGVVVASDPGCAVVRFGDRVRIIDDPRRHLVPDGGPGAADT